MLGLLLRIAGLGGGKLHEALNARHDYFSGESKKEQEKRDGRCRVSGSDLDTWWWRAWVRKDKLPKGKYQDTVTSMHVHRYETRD